MKNLKKNKKGFTLIEMIVVIVIVAILAAISVPAVMKYIDEARNTKLIAKGDGIKVTFQADLAKLAAKGSGKVGTTELTAAAKSAIDASTEEKAKITPCSGELDEASPSCGKVGDKDVDINTITSYVVEFDGTYVCIPKDGAAFVTKSKPAGVDAWVKPADKTE